MVATRAELNGNQCHGMHGAKQNSLLSWKKVQLLIIEFVILLSTILSWKKKTTSQLNVLIVEISKSMDFTGHWQSNFYVNQMFLIVISWGYFILCVSLPYLLQVVCPATNMGYLQWTCWNPFVPQSCQKVVTHQEGVDHHHVFDHCHMSLEFTPTPLLHFSPLVHLVWRSKWPVLSFWMWDVTLSNSIIPLFTKPGVLLVFPWIGVSEHGQSMTLWLWEVFCNGLQKTKCCSLERKRNLSVGTIFVVDYLYIILHQYKLQLWMHFPTITSWGKNFPSWYH